jgi:hypothetical protein
MKIPKAARKPAAVVSALATMAGVWWFALRPRRHRSS